MTQKDKDNLQIREILLEMLSVGDSIIRIRYNGEVRKSEILEVDDRFIKVDFSPPLIYAKSQVLYDAVYNRLLIDPFREHRQYYDKFGPIYETTR